MPTTPLANLFAGQNPFAPSVVAGMNSQPVNFASPNSPNINYSTQQAAEQLGRLLGGNVVGQRMENMASPGSPAPSQPMYGLDFGGGHVANAGLVANYVNQGIPLETIQARLAAEKNNTGWGGPAPQIAWDPTWNTEKPLAQNAAQPWSAAIQPSGQTPAQWQAANQRPVNTNGNPTWQQISPELQNLYLRFALENAQASGQPGW